MTAELVSVALPKISPVLTCALAGSALDAIAKQTSTASQRQTLIHPPGAQAPTEWSCKIEQRSGMGLRLFGGRLEVQTGANQVICHSLLWLIQALGWSGWLKAVWTGASSRYRSIG